MKPNFVVAITGASGATYGLRLLETLCAAGCDVHLTLSHAAQTVLKQEMDLNVDLENFSASSLMLDVGENVNDHKLQDLRSAAGISSDSSNVLAVGSGEPGTITYHHYRDVLSPLASGSSLTDGMVICPCSGRTLGAVASGYGDNLIHRAAEIHLKERRKLILVTRETPLSLVAIENMRRVTEAGAVILPASPGFYHGVKTIRDLVDYVVARICDQLGVPNALIRRWGNES